MHRLNNGTFTSNFFSIRELQTPSSLGLARHQRLHGTTTARIRLRRKIKDRQMPEDNSKLVMQLFQEITLTRELAEDCPLDEEERALLRAQTCELQTRLGLFEFAPLSWTG